MIDSDGAVVPTQVPAIGAPVAPINMDAFPLDQT